MSDPRLAQLYEDVDGLAKKLREVAEAHVLVTPPDDRLDFILIISSPSGATGLHTFTLADGEPDGAAANRALAKMAAEWMVDGGVHLSGERSALQIINEDFLTP
ncbi:MAG: hypothetical protein IIB19_05970 [Chloroflexi bacterium]|nr:hypothetical protein [Chloroflexota bacterium]